MKGLDRWLVILTLVWAQGCTKPFEKELAATDDQLNESARHSNARQAAEEAVEAPPFNGNSLTVPLTLPAAFTGKGGLIAVDVNGSGQMEILITQPNYIAAYSPTDGKLWEQTVNIWLSDNTNGEGLPGPNGPGIQAGDIDNDGAVEILYVTPENKIEVLSGASGELKYEVDLPRVDSAFDRWEHAVIANFSGAGDRDILLQASQVTDKEDYFRDNIQAAFKIEDLLSSGATATPLWLNNRFISLSHGAAKVADIDEDGRDEVIGATILGPDGRKQHQVNIANTAYPHIDSIAIGDIAVDRAGLEVAIPEENRDERVFLFDEKGTVWVSPHRQKSPDDDGDKVAIGDFDPNSPGLEMWFRGNDSAHFTVLNAEGEVIADYAFSNRKPENWTDKGFEIIHRVRWSGEAKDYIAVKERHEAGDVGIFDAITGEIIVQLPAQAQRLYVADILGDWREEIVVLENDQMRVYENTQPNPNPDRPRLWEQAHYRRQKMTWDYYSP